MYTIKITPSGEHTVISVNNNPFQAVADMLGNIAEHVRPRRLPAPYCMVVDEEGLLRELPVNPVGCYLYQTDIHGSIIVGDIYLLKDVPASNGAYDIVALSDEDIANLSYLKVLADGCREGCNA